MANKPPIWAGVYLSQEDVLWSGFLSHLLSWDVPQCLQLPFLFSDLDMFYPFFVFCLVFVVSGQIYDTCVPLVRQYEPFPKKSICNLGDLIILSFALSGCGSAW